MMRTADLISPAYLEAQRQLHADPRGYGQRGSKWADTVRALAIRFAAGSILDYGCGQGSLARALKAQPESWYRIEEYDPAVRGKDARPSFADLVVCTDVLEHVEGDHVTAVIADLQMLTRKALLVVISLIPTGKTLPDGRQAHITLKDVDAWRTLFSARFDILDELAIKPEKQWVAVLTQKERR